MEDLKHLLQESDQDVISCQSFPIILNNTYITVQFNSTAATEWKKLSKEIDQNLRVAGAVLDTAGILSESWTELESELKNEIRFFMNGRISRNDFKPRKW